MRPGPLLGLTALVACAAPAPRRAPPVESFALVAPELKEPAFEPAIAIDRDDPGRIVVGAQYGVGYNRGGRKVWSWQTIDGGSTWTGAEIPLPRAEATLAADVVAATAIDGAPLLGFLFADSTFHGGLALVSGSRTIQGFGPARLIVPDQMDAGAGAVDKPWMAVDRGRTSPLKGTIYLTWHLNRPLPNHEVATTLWLKSTRNRTDWTAPVLVSEHFGGQVAVRPDGTVDVIYGDRRGRALYHRSSLDGGRTFGETDTIAVAAGGFELDLPSIATTTEGRIAVCWTADSGAVPGSRRVECSTGSEAVGWTAARPIDSAAVTSLPAVAAGPADVWALAYRSDSTRTEVVLYRSRDGGRTYRLDRVLATRPFGLAHACLAPSGPCRKAPPEAGFFFPGDYAGLDVSPERVAAAYVLPEGDAPTGRPTVFVTIIRPSPER